VTDRGEEACECVRKYRPDFAVGHILVKAARLRTETSPWSCIKVVGGMRMTVGFSGVSARPSGVGEVHVS
jgi:hypothetical protein